MSDSDDDLVLVQLRPRGEAEQGAHAKDKHSSKEKEKGKGKGGEESVRKERKERHKPTERDKPRAKDAHVHRKENKDRQREKESKREKEREEKTRKEKEARREKEKEQDKKTHKRRIVLSDSETGEDSDQHEAFRDHAPPPAKKQRVQAMAGWVASAKPARKPPPAALTSQAEQLKQSTQGFLRLVGRPRVRVPPKSSPVPLIDPTPSQPQAHHQHPGQLWIDKHSPVTKEDLSVHSRKVKEVDDWFVQAAHGPSKVCVLSGPPGSCKSILVRVCANDHGLAIVEWTDPDNADTEPEAPREHTPGANSASTRRLDMFRQFLLRSRRYGEVCHSSPQAPGVVASSQHSDAGKPVHAASASGNSARQVVVVDELPLVMNPDQVDTLADIVWQTASGHAPCAVVFVLRSQDLESESVSRVFSKQLLSLPTVTHITTNAVAPTFMLKALKRIVRAERGPGGKGGRISEPELKEVVEASNGDLRHAITTLQLYATTKQMPGQGMRAGAPSRGLKDIAMHSRDQAYVLFRLINKVLFAKRDNSRPRTRPSDQRPSLAFDHVAVLESQPPETHASIPLFLHSGYPRFFEDMDDLSNAADALCVADLLHSLPPVDRFPADYGALVATMAMSFHNHHQAPQSFAPLHRPEFFPYQRRRRATRLNTRTLYPARSLQWKVLNTEVLPMTARVIATDPSSIPLSEQQATHIHGLCSFSAPGQNLVPQDPSPLFAARPRRSGEGELPPPAGLDGGEKAEDIDDSEEDP